MQPYVDETSRDFAIEAETCRFGRGLGLRYTLHNRSNHALFAQNQYGPSRQYPSGCIAGGRSPNDSSRALFSSATACAWAIRADTLLVFQGEVVGPGQDEDKHPGYARVSGASASFVIDLAEPFRQWENNRPSGQLETRLVIRKVRLCVEVLLDPLVVEETDGVSFCDFGQPGYLETLVALPAPLHFLSDETGRARGEMQERALRSMVRLSPPP